jgi:quercetin dioxygenase-like cupin family protein
MPNVRKIKPFFTDSRGELSHLLDGKEVFTSALLITCKKGAIRANHFHKKDTHHCYLLSGSMEYSYKDSRKKNDRKKTIIVKAGEMIVTPPYEVHAMKFLEKSSFIALTTEERDQEKYEKDTVRVKFVE